MVALRRAIGASADEPAVDDDGSWHVATRAKPFQTYFESAFPHGKDQFISITASSRSTVVRGMDHLMSDRGGRVAGSQDREGPEEENRSEMAIAVRLR